MKRGVSLVPLVWVTLLVCRLGAEEQTVRGDSSQLPQVDYSKQFDANAVWGTTVYRGGDRQFQGRDLELKTLKLPNYFGNLKPLSLTEFQAGKTDRYSREMKLPDTPEKPAPNRWAQSVHLRGDDTGYAEHSVAGLPDDRKPRDSSMAGKDVPEPGNVTGEELRNLINRGSRFAEPVQVGRGFNAHQLGDEEIPLLKPILKDEGKTGVTESKNPAPPKAASSP